MRYITSSIFALFMVLSLTATAQIDTYYGFENTDLESGPDSFQLFEASSNQVSISTNYARAGAGSLHIHDVSDNGDFPEFQGYFPLVESGRVTAQFNLMMPELDSAFSFALVGSSSFGLRDNGIAVWVLNDQGILRHTSNGIPKRLTVLESFVWYQIEIDMDLDHGNYQIIVKDEQSRLLADQREQSFASGQDNQNFRMYSFIGDSQDRNNANYYIDELHIESSEGDDNAFVAPGRRTLFIDQWQAYYKKFGGLKGCLPPRIPYDFINEGDETSLDVFKKSVQDLRLLLSETSLIKLTEFSSSNELIDGVAWWAIGCHHLRAGNFDQAIESLEAAEQILGSVAATQLAFSLAYASAGKGYTAQAIVDYSAIRWSDDIRWAVASAAISFLAKQNNDAELVLRNIAEHLRGEEIGEGTRDVDAWLQLPASRVLQGEFIFDERTQDFIIAEQYYFALLWQQKNKYAAQYAAQFNKLLNRHKAKSVLWQERQADAEMLAGNLESAQRLYENLVTENDYRLSVRQKLADIYHLLGNREKERELREAIFGALKYD